MNIDDIRKDAAIINYDYIFKIAGDSIGLRNLTYKDYLELDKRNKDGEKKQRKIEEFIENHLQNPKTAPDRELFNYALDGINQNLEKEDRPFDIYSFLDLGKKLFSEEKEEEIEIPVEEIEASVEESNLKTPEEELGKPKEEYNVKKINQGLDGLFQRYSMGKTAKKEKKEARTTGKGFLGGIKERTTTFFKKSPLINNPKITALASVGSVTLLFASAAVLPAGVPILISTAVTGGLAGAFAARTVWISGLRKWFEKLMYVKPDGKKAELNLVDDKQMEEALDELDKTVTKEENELTAENVKTEEDKTLTSENNLFDVKEETVVEEPTIYTSDKLKKVNFMDLRNKQRYLSSLYTTLSLDLNDVETLSDSDLDLIRTNFEAFVQEKADKVNANRENLSYQDLQIEKTRVGIMQSFIGLNANSLKDNWNKFKKFFSKEVNAEINKNKDLFYQEVANATKENYESKLEISESVQNKMNNVFNSDANLDLLARIEKNSINKNYLNNTKINDSEISRQMKELNDYDWAIEQYRVQNDQEGMKFVEGKRDERVAEIRANLFNRNKMEFTEDATNFLHPEESENTKSR